MTQEIKINVTLTLEGDTAQTKEDIENFVSHILTSAEGSEKLALHKYHINKIEEECEIYAPDPEKVNGIWGFVEKYYPNYYSCNEIMRNNALCRVVDGELSEEAENLFRDEFNGDMQAATAAFWQSTKYVYERAIVGYQRSQQGTISIAWSLQDVELRAKEAGYLLNDGDTLKILEMLKDRHDANVGVNWDVIDDYMSYIVPNSVEDVEME
ncbi:MAG: hypothetical protein EOO88_17720 [Pedobacter sp.]|nr:MAG: hypothetical protein EOO88_17720 [Pedobacter sp.]